MPLEFWKTLHYLGYRYVRRDIDRFGVPIQTVYGEVLFLLFNTARNLDIVIESCWTKLEKKPAILLHGKMTIGKFSIPTFGSGPVTLKRGAACPTHTKKRRRAVPPGRVWPISANSPLARKDPQARKAHKRENPEGFISAKG
uniref:Uncharacterized protein n=1 Tax=Romanomermis culicivorax TaxID=13658 RepID=A0A915KXP6_ROMCU